MDKGGRTHSFETHPQYCILALDPSMNDCQWSEIEKIGGEVLGELQTLSRPNLIVDLSELEYIGSAMVALVVRIWKVVKAKNARMVVVNRNPMVMEVFKISKLDEVWKIVEYREDALEELGVSAGTPAERGESNLLAILSVLAALAAAAVLGVHLLKPGTLNYPLLQILGFGAAAIGFVLGLLVCVKATGGRQAAGVLAIILSVGVAMAAAFLFPFPDPANPKEKPNPVAVDSGKASAHADPSQRPQPDGSNKISQPAVAERPSFRAKR